MAMLPLIPPVTEPVKKRAFNFKQEYDTNPEFKASVDESKARRQERQNTKQLTSALAAAEQSSKAPKLY